MSDAKEFNVVCASIVNDNAERYHLPIKGPAELCVSTQNSGPLETTTTIVNFDSKNYIVSGLDVGLSGICLAIFCIDSSGTKWKLYTDIPTRRSIDSQKIYASAKTHINDAYNF